jgi:hypothetical protein
LPPSNAAAPPPNRHRELWSLREDSTVDFPGGRSVLLAGAWGELRLDDPGQPAREALRRMSYGPVSLRNIVTDFPDHDTRPGRPLTRESTALAELLAAIQWLVVRSIDLDGTLLLLSVVPTANGSDFRPKPLVPRLRYSTGPATRERRHRQGTCLESDFSMHRVELHHPAAVELVHRLEAPLAAEKLSDLGHGIVPAAAARTMLAFLVATDLVLSSAQPQSALPTY